MKKLLMAALVCLVGVQAMAQDKQETKYRRSSLYMMMLPDDELEGEQLKIVTNAFLQKSFPDKYNNHNLDFRVFSAQDVKNIIVSKDDISAVEDLLNSKKKGLGKFIGKASKLGKEYLSTDEENADTAQVGKTTNAGYIAKLNKYFEDNNIAAKLFAKWVGGDEKKPNDKKPVSSALVEERGLQTLSQEEIATNRDLMLAQAQYDVIPRTFVMVNRYAYMPAEDVIAMISAAADQVAGGYASLAGGVLATVLKGYFVTTNTYLYQLDLDEESINKLLEKYDKNIAGIYNDKSIKLKYVGKTMKFAPATLKMTLNDDADNKLISRATVRATDAAIADLQKKYDQFKTLSTLHQADDGTLYAFIGKKEGVKEGDKFEVLERTMKDGKEEFRKVAAIKVDKDGLWDNREGAGEVIEGAAEDKDDKDGNANLKYTTFGKNNKMFEGYLIRQNK